VATFTYAVRYWVTATCETPLRSGGTDGDTESVLRRRNGQALLQGASLAGALREWLIGCAPAGLVERLFGSQAGGGRLVVSDGNFSSESDMQIRPRVRVDSAAGCADSKGKGKFDLAHMAAGSKLTFCLVWMGSGVDEEELDAVERMLSALHSGEILLGAQKTNGFGRVSLDVIKQTYNLKNAVDRAMWRDEGKGGNHLTLKQHQNTKYAKFTVTGTTAGLLVKSASPLHDKMGSLIENLEENGKAILPGSSIKGAVRARAEAIAGLIGLGREVTERIFGRGAQNGDNGQAGLVRFEDAILPEQTQHVVRIHIDRFTGGVIKNSLFQEETHSGELTLKISVPVNQPVACALILFALRDLGLGLYTLGSGWAVGRGRVDVREITVQTPEGDVAALRFNGDGDCSVEDSRDVLKTWISALEEAKHEN